MGGRLVLALIFGLSVAFSADLGALHTDYYQGLAARNQLLNVNDNIINRQYRVEKKCAESDVVNTKDGHAFVIFNGGCHKFDKGTSEIYDKSDNLGFILGYEKSCNENLTLGAFAGYSNTDYKQEERLLLEKVIGMEMNRPGAMAMFVVDCLELLYVVEMRN